LVGSIVDLKLSECFHRSIRAKRAIAGGFERTIGEPETAAEIDFDSLTQNRIEIGSTNVEEIMTHNHRRPEKGAGHWQ
jgi:hypothetical protein